MTGLRPDATSPGRVARAMRRSDDESGVSRRPDGPMPGVVAVTVDASDTRATATPLGAGTGGAPHSGSGACSLGRDQIPRLPGVEPGDRHLLGDHGRDGRGRERRAVETRPCRSTSAGPVSNATPSRGSSATPRRAPTRRPSRRSSRTSALGPVRACADHGLPSASTVVSRAPTASTESNAAGYVSRERVLVARRGDDVATRPAGSGRTDRSTSTTALSPTGSSCTPGAVMSKSQADGAERVDDHRRPVPAAACCAATSPSGARPTRRWRDRRGPRCAPPARVAPGTSVAITPSIASPCPSAG